MFQVLITKNRIFKWLAIDFEGKSFHTDDRSKAVLVSDCNEAYTIMGYKKYVDLDFMLVKPWEAVPKK